MLRDASSLRWFTCLCCACLWAAAGVLVCACASESTPTKKESACTYGPQCETGDATKASYVDEVSPQFAPDASTTQSNVLCGDPSADCDPDDLTACANGADPGTSAAAGSSGSEDPAVDAGASMSCQVQASPAGQQAFCAPAGAGASGSPCLSGADCAPGFACVEAGGTALCRRFCCDDPESCEAETYCAERAVRLDTTAALSPVRVPVCVTATTCRLDEPYPCPDGATCLCPTGTACGVVRADGTTDCVPPGDGLEGEDCPCAAGHVCSQGTNTCLKICKLNVDSQCVDGLCQSSRSLPTGYGLCVGATTDAG